MEYISNKILNIFLQYHIITERETAVYGYGIKIALFKCMYTCILVFLCLLLHRDFFQLLIFYSCYLSIRKYTGGYHAQNPYTCTAIFVISYLCLNLFIYYINCLNSWVIITINLLISIVIYMKSPIDCAEKRLNPEKKKKNKKITGEILMFWNIVLLVFCNKSYSLIIFYCCLIILIMMFLKSKS